MKRTDGFEVGFSDGITKIEVSCGEKDCRVLYTNENNDKEDVSKDTLGNYISMLAGRLHEVEDELKQLKYDSGVCMYEFTDDSNDKLKDIITGEIVDLKVANTLEHLQKVKFSNELVNKSLREIKENNGMNGLFNYIKEQMI